MSFLARSEAAAPVRGPKEVVRKGKTPVLTAAEVSALFKNIPIDSVVGLRDRALISVMLHAFARLEAAVSMDVADFYPQGTTWRLRLHEKSGKYHVMPAHHLLAERLHAYISAAGIAGQKDNPLFRAASHKGSGVTGRLNQRRARNMVQRRVTAAGIATPGISNHTFRATGITLYMANGGALETAQEMAAHASSKTTAMYDHSGERRTQAEVERVTY